MTLPLVVRALFGRDRAPSPEPETAATPAPAEHPARQLLAALNARSFESLAECAARRVECGMPHGAVDTVLDGYRNPVGVRVRRYRSDVEAEVDRRIVDLADRLQAERDAGERERLAGRVDVAKRYQALAGLWDLENRLAALPPAPKPQSAPQERPSAAVSCEAVPSQAAAVGFDANIRGLNAQRADVLRDRRAFAVAQFEARQESQARALAVPSADEDVDALRVRLEARLVEWTAANPALVEELRGFG